MDRKENENISKSSPHKGPEQYGLSMNGKFHETKLVWNATQISNCFISLSNSFFKKHVGKMHILI